VIHTALPGSVESYYQEIGRAGRDGKPSRAVLLYGWSDRKLLEIKGIGAKMMEKYGDEILEILTTPPG